VPEPKGEYDSVIGLEIHAQLLTRTKIFCGCPTTHALPPNTAVCDVCLGLPGALPVLNRAAVDLAVKAASALGCTIHQWSQFARKHYFYPDLPKGYQITQYDRPLATGGGLPADIAGPAYPVAVTRLHLEEDAGKSLHETPAGSGLTGVDFNRAGVPLIEIVTAPVLATPADAAAFFRRLSGLLVAGRVTAGNLGHGSLRCDANVSVRRRGDPRLGPRTEIKNLNSFRFLQKALEYEVGRQITAAERGEAVVPETRLWDGARTVPMRSKEAADDYRYFPEPDLPPLRVAPERIAALAASLPERPDARRARLVKDQGLTEADAVLFTLGYPGLDAYWEDVVRVCGDRRGAANWVRGPVVAAVKSLGPAGLEKFMARVPPGDL
jgi:aspartyl-tRNA(Asn)/glutamyl-tRNA(Gln) amidotransferase subunit B